MNLRARTFDQWAFAGWAAFGIMIYLLLVALNSGLFLRELSFDLLQKAERHFFVSQAPNVFVVDINEKTVDHFSQDPLSRASFAQLIRQLSNARVKAIVVDVMFYTENFLSGDDQALRQSIESAGNVFLVSQLFKEEYAFGSYHRLRNAVFADVARGFGYVDFPNDRDGETRKARPQQVLVAMKREPQMMKSLARQCVISLNPALAEEQVPDEIYLNPPTQGPLTISMEDAIDGGPFRVLPDLFAGRIAVIGSSLQKSHVTSLAVERSEAEMLAIEIQNYLSRYWIVEHRPWLWVAGMLAVMVGLTILTYTHGIAWMLFLALISLPLLMGNLFWHYHDAHQFFPFLADCLIYLVYGLGLVLLKLLLTERQHRELRRTFEKRQQLMSQMETLGMLASEIVHDIGSPVALISTDAQVLQRKLNIGPDAPESGIFERLQRNVERVMTVVNRIKLLGRPQPSQPQLKQSVSLKHVLSEAVALVGNMATKHQITIRPQYNHQKDQMSAMEAELTIAITNLVTNAIQASGAGSAIDLMTRDRSGREVASLGMGAMVEITIRDYGSGIAKERLDDIFTPFYTTKKEGTGLGLYTARRTILDHGGSIQVQSNPGQGTTFQILLPGV